MTTVYSSREEGDLNWRSMREELSNFIDSNRWRLAGEMRKDVNFGINLNNRKLLLSKNVRGVHYTPGMRVGDIVGTLPDSPTLTRFEGRVVKVQDISQRLHLMRVVHFGRLSKIHMESR